MKFFRTENKLTLFQISDVLAEFLAYLFSTFHSDEILEGVSTCSAVACQHCDVNLFWSVLLAQVWNLNCAVICLPRIIARFHPACNDKQTLLRIIVLQCNRLRCGRVLRRTRMNR